MNAPRINVQVFKQSGGNNWAVYLMWGRGGGNFVKSSWVKISLKLGRFIGNKYGECCSISELLEDEGADYTAIPKCTRSHILYNHTLLGGLRAGNFTHIAEVDSIETCAALCCAEQTCDLALVLGENCYAGDCASKELCVPVPVHPTANKGSQIAYITSRKKVEEPGTGQY